jgi:3-phenylpropionate/trans-cinnamate dioxygenase ferredoxin reductase component
VARHVRALIVLHPTDHVVIVGAGFGGWRLVEALRRDGYAGAITLIGEETYAPYDRPPLSKHVLAGKWDVERATLATPERVAEAEVTMRLGVRAVDLDIESTTVRLEDGTSVEGTHVVIATGARARRIAFSADDEILTLRNRDDELRMRLALEGLEPGSVIAVIGGGFIGAEVATQLKSRGFVPIVLEVAERPLIAVLGPEVSSWLERLAADVDIELRSDQHISDVERDGDTFIVRFEDGSELRAAVVVLGAGALPNFEWLESSGLTLDGGVVVDENLLARENIAAIGDVARFSWPNVTGEEQVRIEHWEVANGHAQALAHYWMTGEGPAELMVPYFWSDQYGKKIQMLGHARADDEVLRVSGSPEEGKWLALYSRGGVVTGLVTLSQPRALMLSRHLLASPSTLAGALRDAPWTG